jgi:hypothetical protein
MMSFVIHSSAGSLLQDSLLYVYVGANPNPKPRNNKKHAQVLMKIIWYKLIGQPSVVHVAALRTSTFSLGWYQFIEP